MKRIAALISALLVISMLAGCSQNGGSSDSVSLAGATEAVLTADNVEIDVTEAMYVSMINELYTNTGSYIGKVVRIQGMYTSETYQYEGVDHTVYYVYRVGPGCCGNDGSMCGFEFTYDGEMPHDNDWIEVIGVFNTYTEGDRVFPTLAAGAVTVKSERGAETVTA